MPLKAGLSLSPTGCLLWCWSPGPAPLGCWVSPEVPRIQHMQWACAECAGPLWAGRDVVQHRASLLVAMPTLGCSAWWTQSRAAPGPENRGWQADRRPQCPGPCSQLRLPHGGCLGSPRGWKDCVSNFLECVSYQHFVLEKLLFFIVIRFKSG